jgi:hypothetical protein
MSNKQEGDINYGSNITGLGLLLNQEKISNSVNIEDMEKKLKSMYIEDTEIELDVEDSSDKDPVKEYEMAMKEIESNVGNYDMDTKTVISEIDNTIDQLESNVHQNTYQPFNSNPYAPPFSSYKAEDQYYTQKTREESLQNNIQSALSEVPNINFNMEQENEKEQKNHLLEVIESLKDDLEELGVKVDRIPHVSYESSLQSIEDVHKRLLFKYNKIKYNAIAEEALIACANLLELIFNGKNEYFGVKPDVIGYSDVVKSKLKRIRFETSTAVSKFVTHYDIGIGPRICMELLPSLITQSQRRRFQNNDTINASFSRPSINQSIGDLNQIDT